MKSNVFSPVNSSEFVVSVCAVQPHFRGTIYHRSLPEGVPFDDASALALTVEDVLDCVDDPAQAGKPPTSFAPQLEAGRLATLRIDVMFRQHCSWQGKMTWVERGVEMKFRSFLELLLTMVDVFADEPTDSAESTGLAV